MTRKDKLLEKMQRNPKGDWTIADIQRLCQGLGWDCLPPTGGGSHWKIVVPGHEAILTIPARRPIKPVYVRQLVGLIEEVQNEQDD